MPYKMKKQGMRRRERALGHLKGTVTTTGVGNPIPNEGSDGDFTLRKAPQGLILYVKFGNIWYDVSNLISGTPAVGVRTFENVNATPNIKGVAIFHSGTATETITYNVTGTNLKGGDTDIVTASGDATTWIYDGSSWYLISWMDDSANLADQSDSGF